MRLFYATAAALAPLLFAAGAQAQVVINTARTTPVQTSTANNGGAANVQIASGGAVNVTTGTAVTVDSDNDLTILSGGAVSMANSANGSTAVLVTGDSESDVQINGTITVSDNITDYPNTDQDGDADGPWANGSGRYGVRLLGQMIGDLFIGRNAVIRVDGADSYGVSLDDGIVGDVRNQGEVRVVGDRTVGIRQQGTLDGDGWIGGIVNATGEDAVAVSLEGDVTGGLIFQGDLQSTGYRYTQRPTDEILEDLDADDILQGGPTVAIAGNVAGGVVFDTRATESNANSTDDDGDGVLDTEETSSTVNSFGSSAAIQVGSTTQSVTLGAVGAGASNYGFINRGLVTGQGILDGVDAQAIRFGVDGGQAVVIEGGVFNEGQVSSFSYEGNSTGIRFADGVTTPRFVNAGFASAASSSETGGEVVAVLVEAGASLPELTNTGSLVATSGGGAANLTTILDLSGTLTTLTNRGTIESRLLANEDGDAITGTATTIDLRANTSGVTLLQDDAGTSAGADADGDGVADVNEPAIRGDILLGSGADLVDVRNGSIAGGLSFGDGADVLRINGGAAVTGRLADSDGLLDLDVQDGVLQGTQTEAITVSNLNVGSDGRLIITVDGAADQASRYDVSGTATLGDGAQIGTRFTSLLTGPERYTIIDASNLDLGQIDLDGVEDESPYLFRAEVTADETAGEVYLDVRRRTADEAGLIQAEAGVFDAFYAALDSDDALLNAFLSQTGRDEFLDLYEQMLPEHSGGPLLSLSGGVDAVTRALVGRNASAAPGRASAWMQEITFYADKDKGDTYGFRSEGFGVAGGVEMGSTYGNLGVSLAFTSSDLEDPESEAEEVVSASLIELGLYWRAQGQYWTTWARAAGGYATFESTRRLVGSGLNLSNSSSWNGWTVAVAGGASYERDFGRLTIRPEIYAEYFSLSEDAHVEAGGGPGFDLELDEREGHMFSATAAMNVGLNLGQGNWLKPEIRLGWRQNISVDPGVTMGRFVGSTGPDFAITPDGLEGGGPIAGVRLNVGNELGMLSISADAEMIDDYVRYMLLLRASFRF